MVASQTPEGKIKDSIRKYLRLKNWFIYPNTANQFSMKGVPDYTAISPRGLVVQIEVKSKTGKQRPEQALFEREWASRGGRYIIVHDLQELIDDIE